MKSLQLSIIIPTLNEEQSLPTLLAQLAQQTGIPFEIIVADGGSCDSTVDIASRDRAIVVNSPSGRGLQMNAGAHRAQGANLLFLHADSQINDHTLLITAINTLGKQTETLNDHRVAAHFRLSFIRNTSDNPLTYLYYEEKSALNRPECTNGDQGLLLSRKFFNELGGYDEQLPFLEDQKLATKILSSGTMFTLPGTLLTSARRFEKEGTARRIILSALTMGLHAVGHSQFFDHAHEIYKENTHCNTLRLTPFFNLIHSLNKKAGIRASFTYWFAIGCYVRNNAWQPLFLVDIACQHFFGFNRRPFLWFHDHVFKPVTNFRPFDIITAMLTYCWFMTSWAYFTINERV